MHRFKQFTLALFSLLHCVVLTTGSNAADISSADRDFFEKKIRPVLVKHCYECHSADAKELGGNLRLDTREGLRTGGVSGAAIVPGKPDESLLIQALRYDGTEMPPEAPLPEAIVHDFSKWVTRNAPDPRVSKPEPAKKPEEPPSEFWSLQPVVNAPVPAVDDSAWPHNEIDSFVLSRLEQAGLTPVADASPQTLIRRVYYDLVGLPPSYVEVRDFVSAYERDGESAYQHLVDELLSRPQFGERWGRYWLDVARYGESNGNDGLGRNPTFPHAWRYRDYVIQAFNEDRPFNEFVIEQIAGDLLPAESAEQRDRNLVATGFLAMTAKPAKAMNNNFAMDVVADQIDVISRGVMGLSVACARCHDHKFDPVPMRDYYALAGLFTSTETLWGVAGHEKLTAPPTDLHVLKAAEKVPPPEGFVETVLVLESNTGKPKPIPKSKWEPGTPLAMGVRDAKKPADCKLNINGDSRKLGKPVPRGFLSTLQFDGAETLTVDAATSGRLQLAQWITHPNHPLTARVMVNRVWQYLFGAGIVRTPDDFGKYGARPTHPLLLDHLAVRFRDAGWSVKSLVREIVMSRTYRLGSQVNETLMREDGENLLLARHDRRRLDAESLRDSMLAVSGQLDLTPPSGSLIRHRDILINLSGSLHQPSRHRSVYLCYLRNSPPPSLAAFNLPDFRAVIGRRDQSTVPGQALYLFNNPFVIEQAEHLANRLIQEEQTPTERIQLAYEQVFQRDASSEEIKQAEQLVDFTFRETQSNLDAWSSFCQALLITNEFRYLD